VNAGAGDTPFDMIAYFAKTAFLRWDRVGTRYTEFVNKTAGNDRFPRYQLTVPAEGGVVLGDTFRTARADFDYTMTPMGPAIRGFVAHTYFESGTEMFVYPVPLQYGWQKLGIYLMGAPTAGKSDSSWLDFRWVNICRNPFKIEAVRLDGIPVTAPGEAGTPYTLRCNGYGEAPPSPRYIWTFDDGSAPVERMDDSTVTHTFSQSKTYHVSVKVEDYMYGDDFGTTRQDIVMAPPASVSGVYDSTATIIGDMTLVYQMKWSGSGLHAVVERNNASYVMIAVGPGVPAHAQLTFSFVPNPEPFIIRYEADRTRHEYTTEEMVLDTTLYRYGVFAQTIARTANSLTLDLTFANSAQRIEYVPVVKFKLVRRSYLDDKLTGTYPSYKSLAFGTFALIARD
jgi:hypothetical protein